MFNHFSDALVCNLTLVSSRVQVHPELERPCLQKDLPTTLDWSLPF
jgi:hypothetical protein